MEVPVEFLSSWQIALHPVEQQIILRPWVTKPGEVEAPAQQFALSLETARQLERQLAESIRLLETQNTDAPAPIERRRTQQQVPKNRRKGRHFEGSRSSNADGGPTPDQGGQQNGGK